MTRWSKRGVSVIEVLVALTVLSVGALGLLGVSASVNRQLGTGRWSTLATGLAQRRLELLRLQAGDSTGCSWLSNGSATHPGGVAERWSISPGLRSVAITVAVTASSRADSIQTVIACP